MTDEAPEFQLVVYLLNGDRLEGDRLDEVLAENVKTLVRDAMAERQTLVFTQGETWIAVPMASIASVRIERTNPPF